MGPGIARLALVAGSITIACGGPENDGATPIVENPTAAGNGVGTTTTQEPELPVGDTGETGEASSGDSTPAACGGEMLTPAGSCYVHEFVELNARSIVLGDFDGDGHLDLAALVDGDETRVHFLGGDGTGRFASPTSISLLDENKTWQDPNAFRSLHTLSTTGADRLFALSLQVWWSNLGAVSLSKFAAPAWQTARLFFGDLDGDNDDDVTLMTNGFVFESLCDSVTCEEPRPQHPQNLNAASDPRRATMLDLDEDGLADLVDVSLDGSLRLWWWRNEGNGVFADEPFEIGPFPHVGDGSRSWAFADFNGDGHADLLLTDDSDYMGPAQFSLRFGVAGGASQEAIYLDNIGEVGGLGIVDLEGDGADELIQRRADGFTFWAAQWDTLAPIGNIDFGEATNRGPITMGDIDGDGLQDIIVSIEREDFSRALLVIRTKP